MNNIFEILKRIDGGDYKYIDSLADDDIKKISSFLLLKWMGFSSNKNKVQALALGANQYLFKLHRHPKLMYKLLVASSGGVAEFYQWIKRAEDTVKRPETVKILKDYYNISSDEAHELSILMNFSSMEAIINELGEWDNIDKVKKEYGNI